MKKAIEILQEKVTEAEFYLDLDEVNVIVEVMEEYAQQQLKILNIPDVVLRSEQLRAFASYLSNEWNCPDIDDEIIEEYIKGS